MMLVGIRRFIRKVEISERFGVFLFRNAARPISRCFRKFWWRLVLRQHAPKTEWFLIRFVERERPLWSREKLGHHYVGVDCSEEYCQMARKRLDGAAITQRRVRLVTGPYRVTIGSVTNRTYWGVMVRLPTENTAGFVVRLPIKPTGV